MKKLILVLTISLNISACATADVERFMQGMAIAGQQQQYQQSYAQPVQQQQRPQPVRCVSRQVGHAWGSQSVVTNCQ
jgi:hypothetical protein